MKKILDFLYHNLATIVFIILETIAFVMLINRNEFQHTVFARGALEVSSKCNDVNASIEEYFSLQKQNNILAEENANLNAEVERLKNMMDSAKCDSVVSSWQYNNVNFIPAKIVYKSLMMTNNHIIINKGKINGVKSDMGVVADNKVVGMVSSVSEHYAVVLPLINTGMQISAKFKRGEQLGRITWDGNLSNRVILDEIPSHVKAHTGDSIVTSGHSETFPENVLIGTVSKTKTQRIDGFNHVFVNLAINYGTVKYVSVVSFKDKDEFTTLEDTLNEE